MQLSYYSLSFVLTLGHVCSAASSWDLKHFKSLVSFGDSYTDRSRLLYFATHNETQPPVGWVEPDVCPSLRRNLKQKGEGGKKTERERERNDIN